MRAYVLGSDILGQFKRTLNSNVRFKLPAQCSLAQRFKRAFQSQVMCKCTLVAVGGGGGPVRGGRVIAIPSTSQTKNMQMANVLDKVLKSGKSWA